jgi:hypothetical protein
MLTSDYEVVIAILCLHDNDTWDMFCWSWAIDKLDYDSTRCYARLFWQNNDSSFSNTNEAFGQQNNKSFTLWRHERWKLNFHVHKLTYIKEVQCPTLPFEERMINMLDKILSGANMQ